MKHASTACPFNLNHYCIWQVWNKAALRMHEVHGNGKKKVSLEPFLHNLKFQNIMFQCKVLFNQLGISAEYLG